jgi:asparagine synthase (glutamine-hydrolysing)
MASVCVMSAGPSLAIQGAPTLEGRPLSPADLPEVSATSIDNWKAVARRIRGQFSIIAKSYSSSVAVTDLTGTCPIFYGKSPTGVSFASSLEEAPQGRDEVLLDLQGLVQYVTFDDVGGGGSLVNGIDLVPPASVCISDGANVTSATWFDTGDGLRTDPSDLSQLEEEFESIVDSWADMALPSHGRVALLLSGGTDSGLLAALLKDRLGDRLVCITQDFLLSRYSERTAAMETAHRVKLPILTASFGRRDYYQAFAALNSNNQNMPVHLVQAQNLYCLARFALAQGIDSLLMGWGADSLFLGLGHYFNGLPNGRQEYLDAIACLTPPEKLEWVTPRPNEPSPLWKEVLTCLGVSTAAYHHCVDRFVTDRRREMETLAPLHELPKLQQANCLSEVGMSWQLDILSVLRALPEIRILCPFADSEAIRFALRLPPDLLFRDGQTKFLLRDLLQRKTGLSRQKRPASLSPLRFWRFAPRWREYAGMPSSLRRVYRLCTARNMRSKGGSYNELAKLAALGVWMSSHNATSFGRGILAQESAVA